MLASRLEQRKLYVDVERSLYAVRGVSPVKQTVQLPHIAVPASQANLRQKRDSEHISLPPISSTSNDEIARTFAINKLPSQSQLPGDLAAVRVRVPPIAAPSAPLLLPAAKQAISKASSRTSIPVKPEAARAADKRPPLPAALPPLPTNPKPEDLSFFNVKPLAYAVRPKDVRGLVR